MKQVSVAILVGISLTALAQEQDSVYQELDQVVLSYNKWEQKLNEVPNRIVKVNLQTARLYNPQTTADLLGMTGAVFIQKSQLGGGSPMIRGFSTNRILIVVDGVRMNNAIYRSGNLQNVISIDALGLENAEIIFGPGSLIYGSDAIGGVMDFHTLQPRLALSKTLVRGSSTLRYASANSERTGHFDISIGSKKLAYATSITYSNFDDLKMGKYDGYDNYLKPLYVIRIGNQDSVVDNPHPRVQKFTGYSQLNVLQKVRYRPVAGMDLQYGFHYSGTSNVPRYDRLIETRNSIPSFAQWYYGPQLWRMHTLSALHTNSNTLYTSARMVAAYQNYAESRHDRRLNSTNRRDLVENVKAYSFNLDFTKSLNLANDFFYGVEVVTNKIGSSAQRINITSGALTPIATRYPDKSTWRSYAAYASIKMNHGTRFTTSAGMRYNRVSLYAPFDTSFFKFPFSEAHIKNGALTGHVGFVFRPDEISQINLNISTGFRVPNIDDVGKVFESIAGQLTVPNPDLKPEYAYNADLGFSRKNENFKIEGSIFFTFLDNAIARRPFLFNGQDSLVFEGVPSEVVSLQNVAHAYVWGIQGGLEVYFGKHVTWLMQANWIEGKETDDDKDENVPLRHAPPFYGNTSLRYKKSKLTLEAYVIYNSKISNRELAPSEQVKTFIYAKDESGNPFSPAWYTLNAKAGFEACKHIFVSIGWENITNRQYRPYSSGIVAPGSNVVASLKVTF